MNWTVTTQPTGAILTAAQLAYHLRLDTDLAASADEQAYVADLLAAATVAAEQALECSLLSRTITATYAAGESADLPRGPLATIVSVTADGVPLALTAYGVRTVGYTATVVPVAPWAASLVVVYSAGYGSAADVPADLRQGIRVHVGTMYENRESVLSGSIITPVPHSLEMFYRNRSRAKVAA